MISSQHNYHLEIAVLFLKDILNIYYQILSKEKIQKKSFNFLIRLYNIHLISLMLKYGSSILNYFKNWRTYSKKIWMMKSKLWLMLKLNKNKNKFLKEQLKMLGLLIWIVFKFGLNILILKPWEIIWNLLILFLTWLFKLPWKTALLFLISKYCIYF